MIKKGNSRVEMKRWKNKGKMKIYSRIKSKRNNAD